jgi:hypothetical protein
MLSDLEVVGIVRKHIESKFPKKCAVCGRRFASLAEYLRGTKHVGDPVSGDSIDKPLPTRPVGTISFASCPCGSTLVISSAGLDVFTMRNLMKWARARAAEQRISLRQVLANLRERIDAQVLSEAANNETRFGTAAGSEGTARSRGPRR